MRRYASNVIILSFSSFLFLQCSSTKNLEEGRYLLQKNALSINGEFKPNSPAIDLLVDPPNNTFLGIPFEIFFHQLALKDPDSSFNNWLLKKENRKKRLENILSAKQLNQLLRYKKLSNQWLKGIGHSIAFFF